MSIIFRLLVVSCICIPVLLFSQNNSRLSDDKFPDHVPGEIIIMYKSTGSQLPQGNQILLEQNNVVDEIQKYVGNTIKESKPVFSWLVEEMIKNSETETTLTERMVRERNEKRQTQLNKFGFVPKVNDVQKTFSRSFDNSRILLLRLSDPEKTDEIISKLRGYRTSEFEIIKTEYNHLYPLSDVPNDPLYPQQWAHTKTDAESAWSISQGDPNIVIGIVDVGVDLFHEDLIDNLSSKGYDFVDIDTSYYKKIGFSLIPGEDYMQPDSIPMDFLGHGTHCAGIAAARGNNWKGVIGVAPRCTIMPLRAGFDIKDSQGNEQGLMDESAIANAIQYAVLNGANVLSMSFGSPNEDSLVIDQINFAYSNGVVVVAAAGNSSNDTKSYPAASDHVISVAAVDQSLNAAVFTTYGTWVDVAAPGVYILSTVPKSGGIDADPSGYRYLSGTSMATPYVAGLAALILSVNPHWTPDDVKTIIKKSVTNPAEQSRYIGTGLVNLNNALHITTLSKSTAEIFSPINNSVITSKIPIIGKITGDEYNIYFGKGMYPTSWTLITGGEKPLNDTLGSFEISGITDTLYTIRLVAKDADGENESRVYFRVFHTESTLKALNNFPVTLYSGTSYYTADTKPVICDINHDGKKELIIMTNGWLHVIDSSGHDINGWPKYTGGDVSWRTPAVADLNGDGLEEIITVSGTLSWTDTWLNVWDCNGNRLPGWQNPLRFSFSLVDPVVADIDNDGKLNIILTDLNGWIYNYNNTGTLIWKQQIPTSVASDYIENIAVGDLDGDGRQELICISYNAKVYIYNYLGQLMRSFDVHGATWGNVLIGDLDKDGRYEIVTPLGSNIPGWSDGVSVWDDTGKLIFTKDNILGSYSASIGDINRDGYPEICFSSLHYNTTSGFEVVTVVDHKGNDLPGWPRRVPGNVGSRSNIIIANVEGDDFPEIIAGYDNGDVIIYNHDGTIYSIVSTGAHLSSIAVGDLDNDNINELFVHSYDGKLYGWKLSNSPAKVIPKTWPMYMHDIHNTGNFNSNIDGLEKGVELISAKSLNLGSVQLGQRRDSTIFIRNFGSDTLKISSSSISSENFKVERTSMSIPPGQAFKDTVHFMTSSRGCTSAKCILTSNAPTSPDTILLSGSGDVGESHANYNTKALNLSNIKYHYPNDTTVMISNTGVDTLRISGIKSSNPDFSARPQMINIPPGKKFVDTLRITPANLSPVFLVFVVYSNSPTSPDSITISAIPSPDVEIHMKPKNISLGNVVIGNSKDTTYLISNSGVDSLRIMGFSFDTTLISLRHPLSISSAGMIISPGASIIDTIQFKAVNLGSMSIGIAFTTNDIFEPFESITVNVNVVKKDAVSDIPHQIPTAYSIEQNYPNPFNGSTVIRYALPVKSFVKLEIFNLLGQLVSTIAQGEQDAGYYEERWGQANASGIFFCRFTATSSSDPTRKYSNVRKMIILK